MKKLRGVLDKCTRTKFIGVVFGALFTAFIQSSGATTVMEVSFVNAGILTLERSVGLTFGANIGTTITSQLVSLKLTAVAPFIIFIGSAVLMFGKKPLLKKIAAVIFGFGALFLGINFMTGALGQIPEYEALVKIFEYLGKTIPIVATKGTAAGEFVENSGIGWSINYDIQSLKKCLKNIIQNPQVLEEKTKKRTGNKKLSYMESESASSNRRFKVKEKIK